MFGYLSQFLKGLEDLPTIIMAGLYDVLNGLFAAVAAFVQMLFNLLPSMGAPPAINGGDWIGWANWFFPVGDVLTVLSGCLTVYLGWLAVKFALQLVRAA